MQHKKFITSILISGTVVVWLQKHGMYSNLKWCLWNFPNLYYYQRIPSLDTLITCMFACMTRLLSFTYVTGNYIYRKVFKLPSSFFSSFNSFIYSPLFIKGSSPFTLFPLSGFSKSILYCYIIVSISSHLHLPFHITDTAQDAWFCPNVLLSSLTEPFLYNHDFFGTGKQKHVSFS